MRLFILLQQQNSKLTNKESKRKQESVFRFELKYLIEELISLQYLYVITIVVVVVVINKC